MQSSFKYSTALRSLIHAGILVLLFCDSSLADSSRHLILIGDVNLSRTIPQSASSVSAVQGLEEIPETDPFSTLPVNGPAEIVALEWLRLRPAVLATPAFFPLRYPSLPRPPPSS